MNCHLKSCQSSREVSALLIPIAKKYYNHGPKTLDRQGWTDFDRVENISEEAQL